MQKKVLSGLSLFKENKIEVVKAHRKQYNASQEAVELYCKYRTDLQGEHDRKEQAYKNIDNLLKIGYSFKDLFAAIEAYGKTINRKSDRKFIYACQNFFSPEQLKFLIYVPDDEEDSIAGVDTSTEVVLNVTEETF